MYFKIVIVLLLVISSLAVSSSDEGVQRYEMEIECDDLTEKQCIAKAEKMFQEYCDHHDDKICGNYKILEFPNNVEKESLESVMPETTSQNSIVSKKTEMAGVTTTPHSSITSDNSQFTSEEPNNSLSETMEGGKCSVRYNHTCFWGIFVGALSTNRTQASDACEKQAGKMAGVYSNEHFQQLIMLATSHRVSKGDEPWNMWTGMKYDSQLTQNDGTLAPTEIKWKPGHPSQIGYVAIQLAADKDEEGLRIFPSRATIYGVFCEIDI